MVGVSTVDELHQGTCPATQDAACGQDVPLAGGATAVVACGAAVNPSLAEPAVAWLITRIACILAMYAGAMLWPITYDLRAENPRAGFVVSLPQFYAEYAQHQSEFGKKPMLGVRVGGAWRWLDPLVRWDALWYLSVVEAGYVADASLPVQQNICFFPLYPLLIRLLCQAGVNPLLGALLIANLATLATACLLYRVVARRAGLPAARWSLALWLVFPSALFGCVPYADSLLSLIGLLSTARLLENRCLAAGAWAGLASAVRPSGLALAASFVPAVFSRRWLSAIGGGILAIGGVVAFFGYLGWMSGDPWLYPHVIRSWRTEGTTLNPLAWAASVILGLAQAAALVLRGGSPLQVYSGRVTDPLLLVWALALLPAVRRLGWGVLFGALVMLLLPISASGTISIGRYVWAVMPVFIAAGSSLAQSRWRWPTLLAFSVGLVWLSFLYGGGWEVI